MADSGGVRVEAAQSDLLGMADRVDPVPPASIPAQYKQSAPGAELCKKEWRNIQRMRSREQRLLPNVLRAAFPPEGGPHGVASHPPPSYVVPDAARASLSREKRSGVPLGAFDGPRPRATAHGRADADSTRIGIGRYFPGQKVDWSEFSMDSPQRDYVLLADGGHRAKTPASPVTRTRLGECKTTARGGRYGRSLATAVLTHVERPATTGSAPTGGRKGPEGHDVSRLMDSLARSQRVFKAVSRTASPPYVVDLGLFGAPAERVTCCSDHNTFVSLQPNKKSRQLKRQFQVVTDRLESEHAPSPQDIHRFASDAAMSRGTEVPWPGAMSTSRDAATDFLRSADTASSLPVSCGDRHMPSRPPPRTPLLPGVASGGASPPAGPSNSPSSSHLRQTAANLRTYNTSDAAHRPPTAASTLAPTFARPPSAPHSVDPALASPSERIAANYSPEAWGLSPRTLRLLSPDALGGSGVDGLKRRQGRQFATGSECAVDADDLDSLVQKRMALMPLELFDDLEFERNSPEEWVQLGRPDGGTLAYTQWFNHNTQEGEQRRVRVLSYNETNGSYCVRFEHNGLQKSVKRLNLRFAAEDAATFGARVDAAVRLRDEFEAQLRWRFYVDTNDAEEVVDTYDFATKVEAVFATCRGVDRVLFERLKKGLAGDFYANYCLANRICKLDYHRLNPHMERNLAVLQLPPRPPRRPPPPRGVLDVVPPGEAPSHPYAAAHTWASNTLFAASPVVLAALQRLHEHFQRARNQSSFFAGPKQPDFVLFCPDSAYSAEDAGPRPWALKQLEAVQSSHLNVAVTYVGALALEGLAVCSDPAVQLAVNGGESPDDGVGAGMLELLMRASLELKESAHSMTLGSAEAFAATLEEFQRPGDPEPSASIQDDWSCRPLLKVQLIYSDAQVLASPPGDAITATVMAMFDDLADSMTSLHDDFVGSANPDSASPPLTVDGWSSDPRFQGARARVEAVLASALRRVDDVRSAYIDAAESVNTTPEALAAEFSQPDTPLAAYAERINTLQSRMATVEQTLVSEVYTGLVMVDVVPMVSELTRHIGTLIGALLSQLTARTRASNQSIIQTFEEQERLVLRVSKSPEECLQLVREIAAAEAQLEVLKKAIDANKEVASFLEGYRWPVDDADLDLACAAYGWPLTMSNALERAARKAHTENSAWQRKLSADTAKLKADIEDASAQVLAFAQLCDLNEQVEFAARGAALMAFLEDAGNRSAVINSEESLFGLARSEWPRIAGLQKELQPYVDLWSIASEFNIKYDDWMYGSFLKLDAEYMDESVNEWFKKMAKLAKNLPRDDLRGVAEVLREKLEEFRSYLGIIACICNPGMRARHWQALSAAAGFKVSPSEDVSLQNLLQHGLPAHEKALQDISDAASREFALEKQLDKMQAEWVGVAFELAPWKDTGGKILRGASVDEAQMLLDDHSIKAQAMMSSPFAKPFHERISTWTAKLAKMQDIFDQWLTCQVKWMYLGPVYGSEEIAKQMPKERKEFQVADGKYRRIMAATEKNANVQSVCSMDGLLEDLMESNRAFCSIEKSLNTYLDTKKLAFPRFFFLSNDELLEILSETKDPLRVQPFVKKCFEAVQELKFEPDLMITGCTSIEGEFITYDKPVDPNGETNGVERWLLQTEQVMAKSLHSITAAAVADYASRRREEWVLLWPGQVVLSVSQIYWTQAVGAALREGGTERLAVFAKKCTADLQEEVRLVRGELTKLQRATLGALVVIDVHARDVVAEMVRVGVEEETEFTWQAQLRYYWEAATVLVRMLNASAAYGYEYLGNSGRLVITPLTDRCYRTLLGAHHLNLGGAPAGPAGTGKTETTKDLAKAVAIQCVVFNCSDQLDYVAMGKFFKGLSASGAWACFDEFNRIELEVLSVVAQQVLTIQRAKASGKPRFVFEGVDLPIVHTCNVFITMNPGYAGRSELPDNLKALFRDVAMMVPDYAMIAEIMLYSFGYFDARVLGVKLVQTYRLCSEQLSRQDHYDYGMRAVMAVLRAAGNLKRKFPDEAEDVLMLRAINDVNLPKFLDEDVPLFLGILSDLFPGVKLPELDYTDMVAAVEANCVKMNLQALDSFTVKIIQLYEMIVVRHGLMLVGHSFGMKTSAIRVLAAALTDMCAQGRGGEVGVKFHTLNPKAVTMGQLYGQDDPVSKEWSDGVLAVAFRNAARDTSEDRKWLVLDGPVDAIWIENMNTVLDDNKKLCLNSGEIIAMQGLMNLIFEVQDLAVASPATVSRCGMVYVQPSLLGWRPLVESWSQALPPSYDERTKQAVLALCDWLLPPTLRLVTKHLRQPVAMQEQNLVSSLLRLVESELAPVFAPEGGAPPSLRPSDVDAAVQSAFLFALVWSLGACVDDVGREEFDRELRKYLEHKFDDRVAFTVTAEPVKLHKPFPKEGSVYGYAYSVEQGAWRDWMDTVPTQLLPDDLEFQNITVMTQDVVRYTYLMNTLVANHHPLLLVGPTGVGKSVYMKDYLSRGLDRAKWMSMTFGFSAQTSVNMTQDIIDGKLDKRRKGVFGPPVGKRAVVFVDDLNMPAVETYGAQPPIELLRQFMDHSGWYDRKELSFRRLVDVQFAAAMGPPGGGRNAVTNRYLRHFCLISMTEFDTGSKRAIFSRLADWWLEKSRYPDDIRALRPRLVDASLQVYAATLRELLPTPTRSHYTFNLRDLSKIFQGMQTAGGTVRDVDGAVRLWLHEVLRVFSDRLVDEPDRAWFAGTVRTACEEHFRVKWGKVLGRIANDKGEVGHTELRSLLFGDFAVPGADPQLYVEVEDMAKLAVVVGDYLADYNAVSKKPMRLVLFTFALEHVCRVCRVIRQPGGHALLVGLGGSGRQSLTRLAAFMEDYEVYQIELTSTYSRGDWTDDLKAAMRLAGEKGRPTVFLFGDTQIKEESMVEDISNLLNTGEVPNLFDLSDQVTVGEAVSARAKKVGMDGSRADLFAFFTAEVRRHLHIVLAFSPVGDAFRTRLRMFPSLVTSTTINWFAAWPEDALRTTAERYLADAELPEELKRKIGAQCMRFHSTIHAMTVRYKEEAKRYFYVTPTSYLELLKSFKGLLGKKQDEVSRAKLRYENGLEKLLFTESQVNTMKAELEVLKPQLVQASADTDALVASVERETADADKVKAVVSVDEAKAQEEAAKVGAIKTECEGDLAEAMPALQAAIKALDTLTKNDISEVKGMKSPPFAVKLVMEAVCIIKGLKPTKVKDADSGKTVMDYWETSKKMLNDINFLDSLKTFDKDNIPVDVIRALRPIIDREDFDPKKVLKVSKAAFGLCSWVRAMETYDRVAKVVGPKRTALAEAEAQLKVVMDALAVKQAELAAVVDKLAKLDAELSAAKAKKAQLEAEFKLCSEKLDRAGKLIGGLGGEKARWTESAAALGDALFRLSGDMLLASGFVAYLGSFTMSYRHEAVDKWVEGCKQAGIPTSAKFNLIAALGDPVKIRQWNIWGLPKDDFSSCNSIIIENSNLWPLCIDPQGQTNKWIRTMHAADQLVVIKLSDGNYLRRLETALQVGAPVLLENVLETLDAALEPVLLKQTFKSAGALMVKLGDSNVEWSPHFKLYATTKLRNPHYAPELCTKVVLLNFMITPEGLQDQLLGIVVAQERPDLERQKNELIVQGAENKRKLKEIEDQILSVLSSSQGNILEDEGAVNVLQSSKVVSDDISRKQKAAEKTELAIDEARVSYQPIAAHASVLFFCVADMAAIDPMYQYSLTYFVSLFLRSIEASEKAKAVPERLERLRQHFTHFLFANVCRSLFEKDKLLFAFALSTKLGVARGDVAPPLLRFLLTGGASLAAEGDNTCAEWLSEKAWGELGRLEALGPPFEGLRASLAGDAAAWRAVTAAREPQAEALPGRWGGALDAFQRLLVLRALRPDKLVHGMREYVVRDLGPRFVEPQAFSLEPVFAESTASVPLIFVLSAGSDPMADLLRYGDDKGKRVEAVSLGQGQGPVAEGWIHEALKGGFWVVLQNCHLAKSFLPRLEQICEKDLAGPDVHPDFRIWLTSYPSPIFPIAVLENGLKITNEAPSGMRAGLERVFKADPVTDAHFFGGCAKEGEFKNLLFGLAFFHCLVIGRKTYGPVGWNIPYQFNENDLRISLRQLRMFLDEYDEVPLAMLQYTCGECNYGGKVTDAQDRRTLTTLLQAFYNEDILYGGFPLSASGRYVVPDPGPHKSYFDYLATLPLVEEPEVFGLHDNATITMDLQNTQLLLDSLLLTQPRDASAGGGKGRSLDDVMFDAAADILDKLPPDFDVEAVQRAFPVMYEESMNTVLCQEVCRVNALLQQIRDSLRDLKKAVRGLVLMSAEMEKVGSALTIGRVPELWLKKSFPSLKPLGPYVKEVLERCSFFGSWVKNGPPVSFWLPGFFFTQAFLTGSKQNFARKCKIAIDAIDFEFEVKDGAGQCRSRPDDGVFVYGMYLEAADWDNATHELCESRPKVLFAPVPNMHFQPQEVAKFRDVPSYTCPMYKTSERRGVLSTTGHSTNFVMDVRLPSSRPQSHWIKRGTAMLTSLDN